MELEGLMQYGLAGIVLGWFMWRDVTVMKDFTKAVEEFREVMSVCRFNNNDN